jgi:hypothetical protein
MSRFSVASISPEDRTLHWSNFVSEIFFPLNASFSAPQRFHGTIDNFDLGEVSVSRFRSGPVCYDRAKQHLRGRPGDPLLITFAIGSEARFNQGDVSLECKKNGFFIQRGDLPYQFSHPKDNELWVLKVPAQLVKQRIRVLDRYVN